MKRMTMSRAVLFSSLFVSLFLALPFQTFGASGKTRVAVIDFEQKGTQEFKGKQIGEIIAEWLITSLVKTGRFDVVERAQMQKILKEQQLGMTGMINQETAAKVGELLGVKVIITGSVIQLDNTYDVNTRLISVEDGSILKAEKIRGTLDAIERSMDNLADLLKEDFPLEGFVVMAEGKRVMIDLGKIHGVEPGMRFFVFQKGAPVRHPISGQMLKGEDIKIGEISIQNVGTEASWAEIIMVERGARIDPGNLVKYGGAKIAPPAPSILSETVPVKPEVKPVMTWAGKNQSEKVWVDWNGDGVYDLLLGDRDGFVTVYLNQGTSDSPKYAAGTRLKADGKEIKVRSPSAPCLADWDGDGKRDLLVGNGGGYLHLFLNQGSNGDPRFVTSGMILAAGKNLDVGGKASPCVVDWNEDGKIDLLMGNGSGEIFLYSGEFHHA